MDLHKLDGPGFGKVQFLAVGEIENPEILDQRETPAGAVFIDQVR
jgi:hypothetical protein